MTHTHFDEPTGLSSINRSTAEDLANLTVAAAPPGNSVHYDVRRATIDVDGLSVSKHTIC
jgi:hypothetical protein